MIEAPHSIDAEEQLLGATLVYEPAIKWATEDVRLTGDDFYYRERHGTIYDAIAQLSTETNRVDALIVTEHLKANKKLDAIGGPDVISSLAERVNAPGNAKSHAEIVKRHSLERRQIAIGSELTSGRIDRQEAMERLQAIGDSAGDAVSSWKPADLAPALNGENPEPKPSFLLRSDGHPLIYRGKTHSIAAEPEAGKTKLLLQMAREILPTGKAVLFDFETTVTEAVQTLLDLGAQSDDIRRNFTYISPETPFSEADRASLEPIVRQADLVGIDGVTEALSLHGLNPNDGPDIAKYQALLPKWAKALGPAVVELDHVVKSNEARGRWATGNGHKLAGLDVTFTLTVVKPFGRGISGSSKLSISKDRPGHLRPLATNGHKDLAIVHYESGSEGSLSIRLDPLGSGEATFRPTYLMERVSRAIEELPGLTKNGVRQNVNGKNDAKDQALEVLVTEGFIRREVAGQAHKHFAEKPYREEGE